MTFNKLDKWAPYIALIAFLLTPTIAFATSGYTRTPSGSTPDGTSGIRVQYTYDNADAASRLRMATAVFDDSDIEIACHDFDATPGVGASVDTTFSLSDGQKVNKVVWGAIFSGAPTYDICGNTMGNDYTHWSVAIVDSNSLFENGSPAFTVTNVSGGGGSGGFEAMLAASESGAASTTGFSIGALTRYSGDNLAAVFIGSGLGTLLALRYWIAAIMIIAAIIYFTRRGFQFFKH